MILKPTHQSLDMEEKHANWAMGRPVKGKEIHKGILRNLSVSQSRPVQQGHTTEAAKDPFNHRRR